MQRRHVEALRVVPRFGEHVGEQQTDAAAVRGPREPGGADVVERRVDDPLAHAQPVHDIEYGLLDARVRLDAVLELDVDGHLLSLIHISEPTRRTPISYAVF